MNRGSWSHVLNAEEGKAWSGITSSPIFWVALCVAASLALAVFLYVVAARHAAEDAMIGLPEGIQLVDVADTDEPFPTRRSFRLEPPPLPPRKRDMRTPTPHFYAWLPSPDGQVEAKAGPTLPYVAVRPRAPSLLERLDDAAPDAAPSPGERRIALPSLLLRGGPGVSTAFVVEWDLAAGDSSRALLFRKKTGKFGIEESTRRFAGRLDTEPMLWSVALPECAMRSGGGGAAQRVQNRVEWNAIPWTTLPPLGTAMAEPIKVLTTSRERAAERCAKARSARWGGDQAAAHFESASPWAPTAARRRQWLRALERCFRRRRGVCCAVARRRTRAEWHHHGRPNGRPARDRGSASCIRRASQRRRHRHARWRWIRRRCLAQRAGGSGHLVRYPRR